jgi:hypothetical protein
MIALSRRDLSDKWQAPSMAARRAVPAPGFARRPAPARLAALSARARSEAMKIVRNAAALSALVLALAACQVKVDQNTAAGIDNAASGLENAAESAGATAENVAEGAAAKVENAADDLGNVNVDVHTGGNDAAANKQ